MIRRRRRMLARLFELPRRLRLFSNVREGQDADLLDLADELDANDRSLKDLLGGDPRDAEDVPGFVTLSDRQTVIVAILRDRPASGFDGLVAKARAVRLRSFELGYDDATPLGFSLAGDVLRLLG